MKKISFALVAVMACHAADEPLMGRLYVLESVSGDPLPAPLLLPATHNTTLTYADTIALRDDGTGERRTLREGEVAGTRVTDRVPLTWSGTATAFIVTIGVTCPRGVDCFVPTLTGTVANGKLTISAAATMRVPLVYRYLYPPD